MRAKPYRYFSVFSLLLLFFSHCATESLAQSDSLFKLSGKPHVLIFSDINYTFNNDGNTKAFDLTRAYFGYEYFFSRKIYSRLTLDIADPEVGELQMTAFIKYAFLQYKNENFSARFGMIGTDQFRLQEDLWGYRYIHKSFQDAYKLGFSADIGAGIAYSPSKIISFDLSVLNGEGYKKLQVDSVFKTTIGMTLKPLKGLILRGYFDIMKGNFTQTTASLFAAYSIDRFRLGAEYNIQKNNGNLEGNNFYGVSLYTAYAISGKLTVFTRYDNLKSANPPNSSDPWNNSRYGQLIIAGFDYVPVKGVKIAPAYFGYLPYDESQPFTSRIGLYFEIRF